MTSRTSLKVGYDYINFILSTNRAILGHLYQLTSASGINDYFTDLDTNIKYHGNTWKSGSLRFDGLRRRVSVGLATDEQSLKIFAAPGDTLFGGNFLTAAAEGLLDGATIVRSRVVWQAVTGNAAYDVVNSPPVAVWPLFTGFMGAIKTGGASHVEITVRSPLARLDLNMPRNYYQPSCLWSLYDSGCTLLKSAFSVSGTVDSGATVLVIPISGGITNLGTDGVPQYLQGRLQFTSGINTGLQVLINTNDAVNLYLAYPLIVPPSPGDTVTFYPGCAKTFNTCKLKFANDANFRGFDRVPPVSQSV